ncbi:uncharacterized protein HaLaN_17259 [Haematococcus lacustris]|uniref:Uncharacterized protein n=1 Tax=Haematococcus lacustris TaxID=44745 RepID=A0A699ZBV1_HAELA|nr:uncharacterized protein HaLaN_17259 [Haematococcus lacustris]
MARPQFSASVMLFACLLVAASASSSDMVQFHKRTAGRVLLQQAGTSLPATCPVDTTRTTLNLTSIRTQCVTTAQGFCDSCSCALFAVFQPALTAAGVFQNASALNSTATVEAGTNVITSCITGFLAQFISAGVNVESLVALGNCQYPGPRIRIHHN